MDEHDAKHSEKTIALTVYLFTDGIAAEKGKIVPKHACAHGTVALRSNPSHRIKSRAQHNFNSLLEITKAIEDALIEGEIILHPTGNMKKYVQEVKQNEAK